MGAVDDWFDTLDERRVSSNAPPDRRASKGKKEKFMLYFVKTSKSLFYACEICTNYLHY